MGENLTGFASTIGVAAWIVVSSTPACAQDASFGCKVLLCAAASAPSWSGIPYCVPVMNQLFSDLALGHPWPSCPEGGETSGIEYQPYLPCPEGTKAGDFGGYGRNQGVWTPNADGNLCGKVVVSGEGGGHNSAGQADKVVTMAREKRKEPYNVVVSPVGMKPITFWFDLHRG